MAIDYHSFPTKPRSRFETQPALTLHEAVFCKDYPVFVTALATLFELFFSAT